MLCTPFSFNITVSVISSTQLLFLSVQLTSVNSVVFTVKALDADGDKIRYVLDQSSVRRRTHQVLASMNYMSSSHVLWNLQGDARFFRIDLPNSGKVVLDKPLDYETTTHLKLVLWAQVSVS